MVESKSLIVLYRILLYEYYDFFLALQYPSASQLLRCLASKYAMPARMWRYGIYSFLELLRLCLLGSMEHMLTFIYLVYFMMAFLYETVPVFEDIWIECFGDLGRYRMAIEDEDVRDREVWTSVSRQWYLKASDKAPTTGRLYHYFAILARLNAFHLARESIMTFFELLLSVSGYSYLRLIAIDVVFVKAYGSEVEEKGNDGNRGKRALQLSAALDDILYLVMGTYEIIFNRFGDANVLAYVYIVVFLWKKLSLILNILLALCQDFNRIKSEKFSRGNDDLLRPLPEDYVLRGFIWVENVFLLDWFSNEKIDDDERYFEMLSMIDTRKERITWFAYRLAQAGQWLVYDNATNQFVMSQSAHQTAWAAEKRHTFVPHLLDRSSTRIWHVIIAVISDTSLGYCIMGLSRVVHGYPVDYLEV
ncbi:hypothetical protein F5Y16DRAFT_411226 [Xylariaceae sp. FL0255]|nr:hypothetical protein F5Y16DRAFT_411226 [Xylariaceae sp. FL0255]